MYQSYESQATPVISYKQLVETIAIVTTNLVEMSTRAEGLDPALEHSLSVAEFSAALVKRGATITLGDRIRLGQAAGMQGTLAGRPAVLVERVVEAKFGLRKKVMVKLHAQESLARAAQALGLS